MLIWTTQVFALPQTVLVPPRYQICLISKSPAGCILSFNTLVMLTAKLHYARHDTAPHGTAR